MSLGEKLMNTKIRSRMSYMALVWLSLLGHVTVMHGSGRPNDARDNSAGPHVMFRSQDSVLTESNFDSGYWRGKRTRPKYRPAKAHQPEGHVEAQAEAIKKARAHTMKDEFYAKDPSVFAIGYKMARGIAYGIGISVLAALCGLRGDTTSNVDVLKQGALAGAAVGTVYGLYRFARYSQAFDAAEGRNLLGASYRGHDEGVQAWVDYNPRMIRAKMVDDGNTPFHYAINFPTTYKILLDAARRNYSAKGALTLSHAKNIEGKRPSDYSLGRALPRKQR